MSSIVDVVAREILDSRGNPTVEADVLARIRRDGPSAVPSGASTGIAKPSNCAMAMLVVPRQGRQQGCRERQHRNLRGRSSASMRRSRLSSTRRMIDLDGTDNKSRLGANAILAVSWPVAKAAAEESGLPLYRYFGGAGPMQMPVPMMNIINGGEHANNSPGYPGIHDGCRLAPPTFREALRCRCRDLPCAEEAARQEGPSTAVGDEAVSPRTWAPAEALQIMVQAIENGPVTCRARMSCSPSTKVAASEFYKDGQGTTCPAKA